MTTAAEITSSGQSAQSLRIRFSSSKVLARATVASTAAAAASAVASRRFATSWNKYMTERMNSAGSSATP